MDDEHPVPKRMTVDGQTIEFNMKPNGEIVFEKADGKWTASDGRAGYKQLRKIGRMDRWLQGPIDDAFTMPFVIVSANGKGWHDAISSSVEGSRAQFVNEWDKHFRGKPRTLTSDTVLAKYPHVNMILFGDPESNPVIAEALPMLPITWTKEKLVVNGVEYDAKTHVPVLIYPNPLAPGHYVVLNSGHTFHEADFKGTNALLYPRLGDWAVIKPTPTAKDPAAFQVVAAGLFDENWQFPKK
jgi:hypothetical protein